MNYITVAFSHDKSDWISRIMAWFSFARTTHCALVRNDHVIEASAIGEPKGVRPVTLSTFMARHPDARLRKIEHGRPEQVWLHASTRIGKRYDWKWFAGWLVRKRDWQDPEAFTCSELIAWACEQSGEPLFEGDHTWSVTPQQIYMISKEI